MPLSSRPTAPNAIVLLTQPQAAGVWNGRNYPAWPGFNPVDEQTIWSIVADAYKFWDVDVTTSAATKPHSMIAFNVLFGGLPVSGGQANENSFNGGDGVGGIGAFVFCDQLNWSAWAIGRDAVHEAGHTLGLNHVSTPTETYVPGYWMGNPFIGTPIFTQDQKTTLDNLLTPCADVNHDGYVDMADALLLRASNPTTAELVNLGRQYKPQQSGNNASVYVEG